MSTLKDDSLISQIINNTNTAGSDSGRGVKDIESPLIQYKRELRFYVFGGVLILNILGAFLLKLTGEHSNNLLVEVFPSVLSFIFVVIPCVCMVLWLTTRSVKLPSYPHLKKVNFLGYFVLVAAGSFILEYVLFYTFIIVAFSL